MLAAHREQENRVLSHPISSKQQPKTPGMRYPKTPMELGRGNENALMGFAAKNTMQGAAKLGENEKFLSKRTLLTPTESRMRAPLGNKTTNAKAKTNQGLGLGGKSTVGGDKTQLKNNSNQKRKQKQRQRQAELAPKNLLFHLRDGQDPNEEEPEYAPPNPQPLPYQSDVFPRNGLTFQGLSKQNLLKGYYEHFYNPVDDKGVSRVEKQLKEEMQTAIEKAIKRNELDTEEFTWNSADIPDELDMPEQTTRQRKRPVLSAETSVKQEVYESQIVTRSSRLRALNSSMEAPPVSTTTHARGSTTSLVFRSRGESALNRSTRDFDQLDDEDFEPAEQVHKNAPSDEMALAHLQFSTDKDGEGLHDDVPPFSMSFQDDDEDEVFELRLDI